MTTHRLKTWPDPFEAVFIGVKRFEFRKNDRDFQEGDKLVLQEWNPETHAYSGFEYVCTVPYILRGPKFGLPEGYCVISLSEPGPDDPPLETDPATPQRETP